MEDLTRQGQTSVLTLLTQEASNTKFQQYEDRIRDLEESLAAHDAAIKERDQILDDAERQVQAREEESMSTLKAVRTYDSLPIFQSRIFNPTSRSSNISTKRSTNSSEQLVPLFLLVLCDQSQ